MGQKVKLRRSAVAGKKPLNSQIELGELSVNTTDGKVFLAKSGSEGPSVEEIIITNTQNTGSIDIIGSVSASFFTGSFVGDGRGLYNIPASGVTGLSLDRIANGSSTASIDNDGFQINTDTSVTGSLTATEFTGSGLGLTNVPFYITGSDLNGVTYGKTFTKLQFDDLTGLNVSELTPDTAFISISNTTDYHTTGATFNSSNGIITFTRNDGDTFSVDIDGRFLTSYTETDTLATVTSRGSSTTSTIDITAGNILRGFNSSGGSTVFHQLETYWNTNAASSIATLRFDVGLWRLWSGIYGGYVLNVRSNGNVEVVNNVTASSFIKSGGTSTQFLKADGSVDANTYLTAHPSVSAASSSNNSGRTYIQDILLDSFGHITGLTTATETVVNTDRYVTGATFNNSTADLTLTRNDGNTVTVRLLDTLSDVTVTGGTYNSGNQTLTLTKSDGSTVNVNGFAVDTDVNWYTTGATFNTGNGVITGTRNDGGTWTVDIDGRYLTSESDTLATVTSRGSSTSTALTLNGALTLNNTLTMSSTSNIPFILRGDTAGSNGLFRIEFGDVTDSFGTGARTFLGDGGNDVFIGTSNGSFTPNNTYIALNHSGEISMGAGSGTKHLTLSTSGNLSVTGTLSASGYNKSNWDTAYGWGNHASAGYANYSHKYHTFSNGDEYYDSYGQNNNLRLFTENATFDNFRFRSYSNVEYFDGTNWVPWGQSLDTLFDGREETGFSLGHANSHFRFEINRSSGWPTTALFVIQSSWSDTNSHTCEVTLETWNGSAWVQKDNWTYSNFQRGINLHTTSQTHDGVAQMRVTINMDWTDASHNYYPLKRILFLSNFSGGATDMQPFTWDYNKNVTFSNQIYVSGGNSSQWNTAYSWGNHASAGYITGYTDYYTTGATFNTGNGIITFTRNDGGTYNVNIDNRYAYSGHTHSEVTTSDNGFMSSGDKEKLNNIEAYAKANVQSDWNATSGDALILNKPTIPSGSQLVKVYNNVDYIASGGTTGDYRDNYGTGVTVYEGYSVGANRPHTYDSTVQFMSTDQQGFELSVDWISNSTTPLKIRSLRDCCQGWSPWRDVAVAEDGLSGTFYFNDSIHVGSQIVHATDTNTYLQFDTDRIRLVAGGTTKFDSNGTYLTGYTETDTLDTVADRGNTTNQSLNIGDYISMTSGQPKIRLYENDTTNQNKEIIVSGGKLFIRNLNDNGTAGSNLFNLDGSGNGLFTSGVTASSFIKSGGTSTQFLKADGSVDGSTYLTVHPSVSAASSSNNSDRTYIQDILLDGFGHVTGITTATETYMNYYTTGATFNSGDGVITFTRNNGGTYTVDIDGKYMDDTLEALHSLIYTTGGDADTYTRFAIYRNYGTNGPIGGHNTIVNFAQYDGNYGFQLGANTTSTADGLYYRSKGTTIGTWKQVASRQWVQDQNYLTGYTDNYTTGVTLSSNIATFRRNDGGTYNVDLNVLVDVTVTGGTYNDDTSTLTLNKSDSTSFDVTGFTIDTNTYITGHTFNITNGILTSTRNNNTIITVDLDGRYLNLSGGTITRTSTHVAQGSISASNAHLDLYNDWESDTDQKGSILTFTDNYYDGSAYRKTLRSAIKGGTDTTGNSADGYLEFYVDSAGANSPNLVLRLDKNKNAHFSGTITTTSHGSSSNWKEAYDWGDHAGVGYITGYTDYYTTGATFNTGNGIITFTRNDGGTYDVNIDDRYYTETESDDRFLRQDGSFKDFVFEVNDEGNLSGNRWYKVARVNQGIGGLHIRGLISNHVESFASQKVDLALNGRESDSGSNIEVIGTVDVLHNAETGTDKAGIRIIKATDSTYDSYDVYVRTCRYNHVRLHLTKSGNTSFYTSPTPTTAEPQPVSGGNVEIDTSSFLPGIHTVTDSAVRQVIKEDGYVGIGTTSPAQKLDVSGNIKMTETAATTDTDKFVVLDSGVLKYRTGANVLSDIGAAAASHNHDSLYVNVTGDTMTGNLSLQGNLLLTGTATTTNQGRMIDFTGFDKEGTTDFSDRAYIQHTTNTGGHAGSVLVISSQNDSNDGIAFLTNASSQLKHNNNVIWTAGNDGPTSGLAAQTAATASYIDGANVDGTVSNATTASYANNADTLDGQDASAFQAAGTYNTIIGTDTDISYTGATVLSTMTMTDGVVGSHSSRTLTLEDLGYNGDTNANNYIHPTHPGDEINLDTEALTGATVISDLDFNITTDTLGHVTDANATYSTRNLTASDIGAAPSFHNHDSLYVNVTGDTMTGNLTVTGTITAKEFHTEFVSASILYQSGSTKFGDTSDDIHSFTGSVDVSGTGRFTSGLYADSDIRLTTNATYIYMEDSAGTATRTHGINASNIEYIGSVDAAITNTIIGNNTSAVQINIGNLNCARFTGNSAAQLEIGHADTNSGALVLNGVGPGEGSAGGYIWMRLAADHDNTFDRYQISTVADDFQIGTNIDSTLLKYDGGTNQWLFDHGGYVGIGTNNPQDTLHVEGNITGSGDININGTLTAAVKSFNIPHPTQEEKRLVYGVLEGPEHAVYVRGESKEDTIILPEEWTGLVDESTITVQLTPIGSPDIYYYKGYEDNSIKVGGPQSMYYFYYVQATRKDVEPLITVQ